MSGDTIDAVLRVKLKPWTVPNFAQRADIDAGEAGAIPIADLEPSVLEDMALAWVLDLYAKVGRSTRSADDLRLTLRSFEERGP